MASIIQEMPVEIITYEGKYKPVVSHNVVIYNPATDTILATVPTNASGVFPQTNVSPAVGTVLLLSFSGYQGYAGTVAVTTV